MWLFAVDEDPKVINAERRLVEAVSLYDRQPLDTTHDAKSFALRYVIAVGELVHAARRQAMLKLGTSLATTFWLASCLWIATVLICDA